MRVRWKYKFFTIKSSKGVGDCISLNCLVIRFKIILKGTMKLDQRKKCRRKEGKFDKSLGFV